MLQKIGKTRFGTYWLATMSLEQCFPNVRNLVSNKTIKFKVRTGLFMFLPYTIIIFTQQFIFRAEKYSRYSTTKANFRPWNARWQCTRLL
jgi:hypothetical protein